MTNSKKKDSLFNQKQWEILKLRARGLTQSETARRVGTSRANVSMIEWRAKKKLDRARGTLETYDSLQTSEKSRQPKQPR